MERWVRTFLFPHVLICFLRREKTVEKMQPLIKILQSAHNTTACFKITINTSRLIKYPLNYNVTDNLGFMHTILKTELMKTASRGFSYNLEIRSKDRLFSLLHRLQIISNSKSTYTLFPRHSCVI